MIVLDYRDKRPIYEQVTEKLQTLIVAGALEPGSKLPSVRSLAMDLSINPNTIQRAYVALEQEGYIYTVTGRGNYVSDPSEWKNNRLEGLKQDLSKLLENARNTGMTQDTVLGIVEEVYSNRGDNCDRD